jgi:hypothetical protein
MPCCYGRIDSFQDQFNRNRRASARCECSTASRPSSTIRTWSLARSRPVLHLAELQRLVAEHVRLGKPGGVKPHLKIPAVVAGMVAGADSIDDLGLLRHGAMRRLFAGVRAPSTLGTFLRLHLRSRYAAVDSATYVSKDFPQTLVMTPTRDSLIIPQDEYDWADSVRAQGVAVAVVKIPLANHAYPQFARNSIGSQAHLSIAKTYLAQHLN